MKQYTLLFLVFVGMMACQEEQVTPYTGESYIYFYKTYGDDSEYDTALITTKYTLMSSQAVEADTVWFRVHIRGILADTARQVKFSQLEASSLPERALRAEPGRHFVPFDDPQLRQLMVIPADSSWADIPVVLLPDLEAQTGTQVFLDFELVNNENFIATRYRRLGRVTISR